MQHFSEIPNSEPLEFPEFSATSSSSAGRRKCPACADLASSSARPAAALRDDARWGDRDRAARAVHERHDRLRAKITDPVLPQVEANLASHVD